jgi:iron complex outermembrane recepter protein
MLTGVAAGSAAQNTVVVTGVVRNSETGIPVADATVRELGSGRSYRTRADGSYRLVIASRQSELRVTAIGFAPISTSVSLEGTAPVVVDFLLQPAAVVLDEAVALGTRARDRTVTGSAVPVDVISPALLEQSGLPEVWQQLQRLVPSLNTPHIPLGDNHMRPVTLRGLDPHHTLVLVNGKRRHPASILLAGPSVPNRSLTDLSAIPSAAIERIEVLRDGAGAQYGSDAIAGVVNVVLRSGTQRELQTTVGGVYSSEGGRDFRDGQLFNMRTSLGMTFTDGGYVTFSGEFRNRSRTNRAYPDARPQYFAGDSRNDAVPRVSSHFGNGAVHDLSFFLNAAVPLTAGIEVYGYGGAANRNNVAPDAFFRRPNDPRTVRSIHPNGFLPLVGSLISDLSALTGVRGELRGWRWDISSVWGGNNVSYTVRNSNNVSLGAAGPTDFYAGRVAAQQWTSNAEVSRALSVRSVPVGVAAGAEYRVERYQIRAGEPDSWRDGRVPIADGPTAGRPAAAGAQGLVGFRPIDEVSPERSSSAAYVEVEARPIQQLLLQGAGRAEHYSDFGSTSDGKLAARMQLVRGLAVRGSASTGFRAPALSQEYLSRSATSVRIEGAVATFLLVRTFPVSTAEAQLLGATPLRPEKAANGSAGFVVDLPRLPVITADYYQITIRDRIGLAGTTTTTDTSIIRLFEENGLRGIGGGAYFRNAWTTRTRGVDVVATQVVLLGRGQLVRLLGGYNYNATRVTHLRELPPELAIIERTQSGRTARGVLEHGQPRETFSLSLNYGAGPLGVNLHNQRSGPTAQLGLDPAGDQIVHARWITDLRMSYRLGPRVELATSVANLFDVYPNEWFDFKDGLAAQGFSMQGIFRHPGALSPYGMNGRTVYVQLTYR